MHGKLRPSCKKSIFKRTPTWKRLSIRCWSLISVRRTRQSPIGSQNLTFSSFWGVEQTISRKVMIRTQGISKWQAFLVIPVKLIYTWGWMTSPKNTAPKEPSLMRNLPSISACTKQVKSGPGITPSIHPKNTTSMPLVIPRTEAQIPNRTVTWVRRGQLIKHKWTEDYRQSRC